MNLRLVSRLLGMIAWLIGLTMAFSLPWAWDDAAHPEWSGFIALVGSIVTCVLVGFVLR